MRPILELSKQLIIHAQAAFGCLEDDSGIADAKWVLEWIPKEDKQPGGKHAKLDANGAFYIKQNDLHRSSRFNKSKLERVVKALAILQERNIVSGQYRLDTKKPTSIYFVNPAVMKEAI